MHVDTFLHATELVSEASKIEPNKASLIVFETTATWLSYWRKS